MKYKGIAGILIISILVSINAYSQEVKIKKSEFKDLMEDLRLRKKSLEMEREYLIKFLQSFKDLDLLIKELDDCKRSEIEFKERDTLGIN